MKKLIILFLLLPSLLFSQVSPSKIERIADANTVFGSALSYGTYLVVQSNNKTYKIISVNGVAGTAKLSDLVLNTDYIEEGSVTSVSTAAANNGVTATWSMASPTPALTIGLGAITPTSVNGLTLTALATGFTVAGGTTSKTLTVPLDASVSGTNTGDQTTITGNAGNVTGIVAPANGGTGIANNAAMTVTGAGNFAYTRTLTAATNVTFPTSGTLVSSVTTGNGVSAINTAGALAFTLGAITPTTVNGNTLTTGSSTYTGTAGQTYTFPTTTATIARTDAANNFTGVQTMTSPVIATPEINGTITGTTVIPIGNGGTGATSQNWVDLTAGQTAAGAKIWSDLGTFNSGITSTGDVSLATVAGDVAIGGAINPTYKLMVYGKLKTNAINETSDQRYKKDIKIVPDALNKVLALRGVNYLWRIDEFPKNNFDTTLQLGLIAQEIEKIVPEVVLTDDKGFKSVEYSKLVALLIEAVKEQQKTIDQQKLDITNMKSDAVRIKKLEAEMINLKLLIEGLNKETKPVKKEK